MNKLKETMRSFNDTLQDLSCSMEKECSVTMMVFCYQELCKIDSAVKRLTDLIDCIVPVNKTVDRYLEKEVQR